jgi:peptidoglycan/xylan/chitin deacetylase (PgdA/CDA1 family)
MAKDYPSVVRELMEDGFEIGSHGFNHEFPVFEEKDAILFADIFNTSFEYQWNRSAKTMDKYERALKISREDIKNATGEYPRSYRSPILTPSYTKDMRYIEAVERAGFIIDSSISRRYMEEEMLKYPINVTIVPVSLSDSELKNKELVMNQASEHYNQSYPFVLFFHPWRFSEEGHFELFKNFLNDIEEEYEYIEYLSIEEYVAEQSKN